VRLMTVHKAKGLEFPVVILADLTCRMSRDDASRYLDGSRRLCAMKIGGWAPHELHEHEAEEVARDQAEGVRLAYVAATRARDLLVVPALGDSRWEGGWLSPLNGALYPPLASRRSAIRATGCPAFRSQDSVLQRPDDEIAGPGTVCPGAHAFAEAGYSVVWWDPAALVLGAKAPFGVRRGELIVKDVPRHVVADGRTRYDQWHLARDDARAAGAVPSVVVETVREWIARNEQAPPAMTAASRAVRTVNLDRRDDVRRPRGAGFGSLVHAVLAQAPLDAPRHVIDNVCDTEARMLGLSEDEAAAAATVAERVLAQDLLARARAADAVGRCRRETPVTCTLPDGTLVEGVVDLAFEDAGRWVVVDYKTDRELAALGEDRYRLQVAIYASAIAQATGASCDGVLMVV
jgi:ATP-dependent helicase/nuclease subunit A